MTSRSVLTLGLTAALLSSYCGAGSPQNEVVREHEMLALWDVSTKSDEARAHFEDGLREFDMTRDVEANELFKRAAAADPQWGLAQAYVAFSTFTGGARDASFAQVRKAVELSANGNEHERLVIEAISKAMHGDEGGAIEAARKLVAVNPSARSYWVLGLAFDFAGDTPEARKAAEKAIEINPAFLAGHTDLAMLYTQREPSDPVRAESFARKAAALAPNDPHVYDVLGDALRMRGKLDEAAQAYSKYAELDPTDGGGLQQRGHVNMFLNRFAEARADYDAAVAVESGNRKVVLALYRSFVSLQEKNPKAAVDELEKLYNAVDGFDVADPIGMKINLLEQGLILIPAYHRMIPELERNVARYAALQRAFADKVDAPDIRRQSAASVVFAQGLLAYAKGDYARARSQAAEYVKLRAPDNSITKNRAAHELLGLIALEEGRYAEATAELDQAGPDNMFAFYHKGLAHEKLNQLTEAEQMYQKIASFYLAQPGAAVVRQDALARLKKITS